MAQTFNSKLSIVAEFFIKRLNVKVTRTSIREDIEENAYYPSLLSLSDTLHKYNIPNAAFDITADDFSDLQTPFVAFANIPVVGSDFLLVTKIEGDQVSYVYDNDKPKAINKDEFLTWFKNVVLYAEPDEKSAERDYSGMLKKEQTAKNRNLYLILAFAIVIILLFTSNLNRGNFFSYGMISLIKFAGLSITILLLIYELDKNNGFVKNICSTGAKTNCDAVLTSSASKIWGISWAEIGFFYFASTTIGLLMPGLSFAYKSYLLSIVNLVALPYIFFSIYYQWRVIKQWCPLCLSIQTILLAELVWSIANFWFSSTSHIELNRNVADLVSAVIISVLIPITTWYFLKPVFLQSRDYKFYLKAYKRLQYNPEIFQSLLMQQQRASSGWEQLGILVGNPNASNTILKVCNPYCGPCGEMHPQLEEVIKQNENINLKIIFTSRTNETGPGVIVVRHLLAIASEGDISKTQEALDDWYLAKIKDYGAFAAKYPVNGGLHEQDDKINAMSKWCYQSEISHTPTIFINGYRLPENYNVEELKHIF